MQSQAFLDTSGTFRGRGEGLDKFLGELYEGFDQMRFVPQTAFLIGRERMLLLVDAWAVTGGLEMERAVGHLFEFRDGYATRMVTYWDQAEALEAVGLSE